MVGRQGGSQSLNAVFYLSQDGQLMASQVGASGSAFQASVPKPLFRARPNAQWDVSPD